MSIYLFERTVFPRRFGSPFIGKGALKGPGGIGDSVVEKTVTYVGDKTKINRRGTQVGRVDLVNGSTSDLVRIRVPVHLQHNRRVHIHIRSNFSRSHSKYYITRLYRKIGQSSVLLEVAGTGHVEKFPPENHSPDSSPEQQMDAGDYCLPAI